MFFYAICETFKNTYFEEYLQMAASVGKKTVRTSIENEKEQNSEKARAILLVSLTNFSPVFHFYTPWTRQKTNGNLTFSRGMEMDWSSSQIWLEH